MKLSSSCDKRAGSALGKAAGVDRKARVRVPTWPQHFFFSGFSCTVLYPYYDLSFMIFSARPTTIYIFNRI